MASKTCPCGSGAAYETCCGAIHAGSPALTAEQLMRARYTAFARGDVAFLLRSWAPETRPAGLTLDPTLRWVGLEITATTGGGPFHREATVAFLAHYRQGFNSGVQTECSRFRRAAATGWVYIDASAT